MEMIRFDGEGEVRLRDWRVGGRDIMYDYLRNISQKTKFDDLQALGNMMLEVGMLVEITQILKTNAAV